MVTSLKCSFLNKKLMETFLKCFGYYPAHYSLHKGGNQNCPLRGFPSLRWLFIHFVGFWVSNSIFKCLIFCTSNILRFFFSNDLYSPEQTPQQSSQVTLFTQTKKWNGRKSEDVPFAQRVSKCSACEHPDLWMSLKIRVLLLSKSINILFLKIKVWSLKKTEQKLFPPTTDN